MADLLHWRHALCGIATVGLLHLVLGTCSTTQARGCDKSAEPRRGCVGSLPWVTRYLGDRSRGDGSAHDGRRLELEEGRRARGWSARLPGCPCFQRSSSSSLSIGPGKLSPRISRPPTAGSPGLSRTRTTIRGLLDAIAFWDESHGIAQGDPVDGRFLILTTDDGGLSWHPGPAVGMPRAGLGRGLRRERHLPGRSGRSQCLDRNRRPKRLACCAPPIGAGAGASPIRPSRQGSPRRVSSPWPFVTRFMALLSAAISNDRAGGRHRHQDRGRRPDLGASLGTCPERLPIRRCLCRRATTPTLVAVGPSGADISSDDGENWKPLPGPGGARDQLRSTRNRLGRGRKRPDVPATRPDAATLRFPVCPGSVRPRSYFLFTPAIPYGSWPCPRRPINRC